MVVKATKISQKIKGKSQLNIEKYIMNMKKIAERLLNKVSLSSYKSKIRAVLE